MDMKTHSRGPKHSAASGQVSMMLVATVSSVVLVVLLSVALWRMQTRTISNGSSGKQSQTGGADAESIFVYCAAGMRYPMEQIAKRYQTEFGVTIEVQYGGSNTLLNQLQVSKTGDLYLAADEFYIDLARQKNLLAESIPLSRMRPVIVVSPKYESEINSVDDLVQQQVKLALGDPGSAAVGKKVRRLLKSVNKWDAVEELARNRGVFKPTVNEVANAVKIGSVDAGVVWDSTAAQYPQLKVVAVDEFDAGDSMVQIGVLQSTQNPASSLHFARYVAAFDRGLDAFRSKGFRTVEGDLWEDHPRLTFFAGSINRRALEPVVRNFEKREGVKINTVFNGCGILTATMRTMKQESQSGFPDAYMACDVYYLDTVRNWFQENTLVTEAEVVIVVQKGNPKGIQSLDDLIRNGIRVAVGHPKQCTIGVLSKVLLEESGVYQKCKQDNVVTETATSALLVPAVTTGAADAALAYRTDTMAESSRIDVLHIDSDKAKAVQPFAIARTSPHKELARRLFFKIARSKEVFEQNGFQWLLQETSRRREHEQTEVRRS